MVKLIFFFIFIISALARSSESTAIWCNYNHKGNYYGVRGEIYHCVVSSDPNIKTKEAAQITEVKGENYYKDEVLGFTAESRTHQDTKIIQFFPNGLEKFFKNLKAIKIWNCQLKEIHQSDLKVFPHLEHLELGINEIEVIEKGLFDFNPNLKTLEFDERKIVHVEPNAFDHLNQLSFFGFTNVPCTHQFIVTNIEEKMQEAVQAVKSDCFNYEFVSFDSQLKNLEIESKTLSPEAFKTKFESFEKIFQKSDLSRTRTLNSQFQNLKSSIIPTQIDQVQTIPIPNPNDVNLSNDLKNNTDKSEDLKGTQCCLVDDLKASQNELQSTLSEIMSLVTDHGSKLDQIPTIQDTLTAHGSTLNYLTTCDSTLDNLKASHNQMSKTLADMDTKIDEIKKEVDLGRYVLSMSMDSKLKAVENRLMEKIERILRALYIF